MRSRGGSTLSVEETSDVNSYGFRPYRGAREATAKIRDTLGKDYSPNWLLDAEKNVSTESIMIGCWSTFLDRETNLALV
jgi:hypothetical protein